MILELDCGNSFIKWRVLDAVAGRSVGGRRCRFGSCAAGELEGVMGSMLLRFAGWSVSERLRKLRALTSLLERDFDVSVVCAAPRVKCRAYAMAMTSLSGLGLDRWLAMLGGFHLASGACLVLDFGTAVTADFIAADGEHLGGFICPGMPLMRNQLRTHTRKIRYGDLAAEQALESLVPGRSNRRGGRAWVLC